MLYLYVCTCSQTNDEIQVDRVGFEPTTSAMPMPHPTGLDDRPPSIQQSFCLVLIRLMK
jgi:hypothetical protein